MKRYWYTRDAYEKLNVRDLVRVIRAIKHIYANQVPVSSKSLDIEGSWHGKKRMNISGLIKLGLIAKGDEYYELTESGKYFHDNLIIWHIAYDGGVVGDWWNVIRSDEYDARYHTDDYHKGFQFQKGAGRIAIDNQLHRGRYPLATENLDDIVKNHPNGKIVLPDYFYADTLFWFATLLRPTISEWMEAKGENGAR